MVLDLFPISIVSLKKSYGMETIAKRSGMTLVASDEIGTDGIKKSLKKLGQSCGGICIDRVNM